MTDSKGSGSGFTPAYHEAVERDRLADPGHAALVKFARWVISGECWDIGGHDGGDVQDKAVELGLLEKTAYDPAIHGPNEHDAERGDPWYVFAGPLREVK